jgi:F-type H+-transporting ATPase subunit b
VRQRNRRILLFLADALIVLPAILGAAEGQAGSRAAREFLGKVINFAILFGGLAYILRKPVAQFLARRTESVRSALKAAAEASRDAESKLRSIEERVRNLQAEVEDMKKRAEAEGLAEKERIMQAAQSEAAKLKNFARQEVDAHVRTGIRELKAYAADRAFDLALERVKAKLSPEVHARLIDQAIDRLTEIHEKTNPGPALRPRTH